MIVVYTRQYAQMFYTYMHMWMIDQVLQMIFPARCLHCDKEGAPVCIRCLRLTRKSLSTPTPFVTSLYDFRDPLIKRIIHAVKYKHRKELLAPLVLYALSSCALLEKIPNHVLVPIPMTRFRKLLRGYNHAEEIARIIGNEYVIPVRPDLLTRIKRTKRQALSVHKEDRLQNQRGSFAAHAVQGLRIMLIDDVTTTGATLEEARGTLLAAGALSVNAFTLAH